MTRQRPLTLVLAALAAALAVTGPARADGDPASDVLYSSTVFFSFTSTVSDQARKALLATVERSQRAGYPIRVAVIEQESDLGAVTSLWGKPRRYARFLDIELGFVYQGPLLVVTPHGLGFAWLKHPTVSEYRTLAGIRVGAGADGLAATAIAAVTALATRAGHPVTPVETRPGSGGSSLAAVLGGVAGGLVVLALAAAVVLRRRGTGHLRFRR